MFLRVMVGTHQPGSLFTNMTTELIGALIMLIYPIPMLIHKGAVGELRCYCDPDTL